jgi:hypothetical protein
MDIPAKDIYDIVKDLIERLTDPARRKSVNLSEALKAIADLLDATRKELESRRVPRRGAHELLALINYADILATEFKREDWELERVFERQLPEIGRLMKDADFFIDGQPRYRLHHSVDTASPNFAAFAEPAIKKACEEMERAAGDISGIRLRYEQRGRK